MLTDLDEQMAKRRLQGIVAYGDTTLGDPDLTYLVGGALARGGIFVKRLRHEPLLVTSNLDIGSAKRLGRVGRIETSTAWGLEKIAAKYGRENSRQHLIKSILRGEGIDGRVSIYGRNDLASGVHLADELRKLGVRVVGETSPTVLESARETKSAAELASVREVGGKTAKVVEAVLRSLQNMKRKRAHLYSDRTRATVGLVKKLISSKLAEEDLIAPEGTIFAIGPSGADPHNAGHPTDPIKQGSLIVFDIFPQAATGYWFDLTRTFVIGRAERKAKRLYESVAEAQNASLDLIKDGVSSESVMLKACQVIEHRGYRTIREVFEGKTRSISSGFNHGLGHGVGLTIGERPYLSLRNKDPLKSRQVVTVEPGIYLPGYGGVRIEDTVTITSRGIENLASVDKQLELA